MARRTPMEERILSLKAEHDTWGARRIARQIQEEEKADVEPVPWRTVARVLQRKWNTMTKDGQAQYRMLRWPESMGTPDLPWEASGTVLELFEFATPDMSNVATFTEAIRILESLPPYVVRHPDVRLAKWYWRVTQALPRDPPAPLPSSDYRDVRTILASFLRDWEIREESDEGLARAVEATIAVIREEPFSVNHLARAMAELRPWTLREEAHNEQTGE